jgi:uncharacterized repeat protein (TIGR02543 family)
MKSSKILLSALIALIIASIIGIYALIINHRTNVTVTFVSSIDGGVTYYQATKRDKLDLTKAPEEEGYMIIGYYLDPQYRKNATNDITLTSDSVVFTLYILRQYNIVYHDGDNIIPSPINPISYNITTPTFILASEIRSGISFLGWYSDPAFNNQVISVDRGSVGNLDLYARFSSFSSIETKLDFIFEDQYGIYQYAYSTNASLSNILTFLTSVYLENRVYDHFELLDINYYAAYFRLVVHEVIIKDSTTKQQVGETLHVRHGATAVLPVILEIAGYNTSSYSDNGSAIVSDTVIYINRIANINTAYTVNHILVSATGETTLVESQTFYGVTDSTVSVVYGHYQGYYTLSSGAYLLISADGSSIINLYYYEVV